MNDEKYYIISDNEDGLDVEELSKDELIERIIPEDGTTYYGDIEILDKLPEVVSGHFNKSLNDKVGVIIIKGKIVIPKVKKIVEEYEVE